MLPTTSGDAYPSPTSTLQRRVNASGHRAGCDKPARRTVAILPAPLRVVARIALGNANGARRQASNIITARSRVRFGFTAMPRYRINEVASAASARRKGTSAAAAAAMAIKPIPSITTAVDGGCRP